MGLHASYQDSGFNVVDRAIEGDGGYPYFPYVHPFPYNPATYDEDLIENLHEERQFTGFFHTRANMSFEPGDVITIESSQLRITDIIETFGGIFLQEIRYRWHTEPLALSDYGIVPTEQSTPSISIAPIQGHTHTGSIDVATAIHAATAKTTPADADEFPLADSAASYILKKLTWTNIKATLKTYFDTLYSAIAHTHTGTYAPAAEGVTNGNSHNHVGGDGAALTYADTIAAHGLNATIAAGATQSTPPFYYGLNAARFNLILPHAGTLALFSLQTNSAQPGTGNLVATVIVNNAASALTVTVAAGGAAQLVTDSTHTVAVSAGDLLSIDIKNNAATASAQINSLTLEYRANTT